MSRHRIVVVAIILALSAAATSQVGAQSSSTSSVGAAVPSSGNCATGTAHADLAVNSVRSRVFTFGSLAYGNGDEAQYVVPRRSGVSPLYAANIWIGGRVGNEVRAAAARYWDFEFWPGPLDDEGRPVDPDDCSEYDRIWRVARIDIVTYEETGRATEDLAQWPAHLGAPVIASPGNGMDDDGDGIVDEGTDNLDNDGDGLIDEADEQELRNDGRYDLAAGDRPYLIGDEALWWIMNDAGNTHQQTGSPPIGIEVRVHAFGFYGDGPEGNATFYRYTVTHRGDAPFEEAYFSIWSDPDLGDPTDDYVGVDTSRSLAYVYNANPVDNSYGLPPAAGFDILRGPVTPDGSVVEASSFMVFVSGGPAGTEVPQTASEIYHVQQGRWRGGQPITEGGLGFQTGGDTTQFMLAGDPVTTSFWSDVNRDGMGMGNQPGDRRMVISTGPFTLDSGASQEILYGILWARGADQFDSIRELRAASDEMQQFADAGFAPREKIGPPIQAPVPIAPGDGAHDQPIKVALRWTEISDVSGYQVQIASDPDLVEAVDTLDTYETEARVSAQSQAQHFWRVRGYNPGGYGPWSETVSFETGSTSLIAADALRLSSGAPAFVEISGPNGAAPCDDGVQSPDGCDEVGGNLIYDSINSTGDYLASGLRTTATPESIGEFAPHHFEIRFTEAGSYGVSPFHEGENLIRVPFEIWDVGSFEVGESNDPSDDRQLISAYFSDSGGNCRFAYGEIGSDHHALGWPGTDRIYAYYPDTTYAAWEAHASSLLEGTDCTTMDSGWDMIDVARSPIRRFVLYGNPDGPNYRDEGPPVGTVIRLYTQSSTPPIPASPPDDAFGLVQPVALWWNSFDAPAYRIQVDDDASFSSPEIDADSLTQPTFTVSELPTATYYWRVMAENPTGGWTDWSDAWRFSAATNIAAEYETFLPDRFQIASSYPNPFNPTTTVRYGVPRTETVRIEVFDVLGRRVATLFDQTAAAGWHTLVWHADGMSSGTYFIRLTAGGETDVHKVLLLR